MTEKKATKKTTTRKTVAAKTTTTKRTTVKKQEVAVSAENAGFRAGDVYQTLAAAEKPMSVAEIAMLTGFSTTAHFTVAFKKQFGAKPSEYGKKP